MAVLQPTGPWFVIDGANTYKLGSADAGGGSGGWVIHLVDTGSFSGSIAVQGQARALELAGAADALLAIPYRALNVNGTVGDGGYASTAITTESLIFVPAMAIDVALVVTYTSGSMTAYVTPMVGSCGI